MDRQKNTFGRQAIPMVWDYTETNPFAGAGGDLGGTTESLSKVLDALPSGREGLVTQLNAVGISAFDHAVVSTDPPYYDNVGYADLSDFFYVWLRRSVRDIWPDLFRTMLVPKTEELIASPYRHDGSKSAAEAYFEEGLERAFGRMRDVQPQAFPMTVYYAFKQRESDDDNGKSDGVNGDDGLASTGWETMLEGLIGAGLAITATWPMRTELSNRMIGRDTNALASSIVLACRPRPVDAPEATRREFMNALRRELADELAVLLDANIAPVDLARAVIGPGLAIYTRYSRVVEADGRPMSIRTALVLINDVLDQLLEAHDERLDPDSRFCVGWYEQFGYAPGPYGQADVLARAKGVSVDGLKRAGVVEADGGKVRILRRDEMPGDWDPATDHRTPIWECLQHLVRRLETDGIDGAGELLARVGDEKGDLSKQLAVRLFEVCDRKKWAADAYAYNQFAREFPDIQRAMQDDRARYDAYVREYPEIQRAAGEYRRRALEQGRLM